MGSDEVGIGRSGNWMKWVCMKCQGKLDKMGVEELAIGRSGYWTKWVWMNWLLDEVGAGSGCGPLLGDTNSNFVIALCAVSQPLNR